jgi:diguanylate cyclase (GGDEF)-like protein
MAQGGAEHAARLSPVAVAVFLLLNLVPLAALLPGVESWAGGTMHSYALLPVVVLPTVVLATHASPLVYRLQLVIAIALCAVTIVIDSQSTSILVAGAFSTIGTLIFTTVLIERSRRALASLWADLRTAGVTDPLTGALNRRGAVAQLPSVTKAAARAGQPVGVAVIDLDHFKRINDEYGHAVGDEVLGAVCDAARDAVGESGIVVRSGGEELVLLTVGDPGIVADVLMARLAAAEREPRITISVGLVRAAPAVLRGNDDLWAAVGVADLALYRAKAAGRDRVEDGGDFFGASPAAEPDNGASDGYDAPRALPAPRLFEGFGTTGAPPWQRTVERAKQRHIDPATHLLYQVIVGWTMLVGMVTTIQQMAVGSMPVVQGWVMLPVGWLFGGVVILVMRRLKTSWALTPIFAGGSVFELAVVYGVGVESRPAALMLSLLVGLLVVLHWPHWPVLAQMVVTVVACVGAAMAPDRPAHVTVAVTIVTAISLVVALAMVAAQRRREEAAEVELRWRALTDPLTGLGNRRALHEAGGLWPTGYIAMTDVDSFKALNDRYGHGRGDAVLRALAIDLHAVAVDLDANSRVFRIGGDEFVIAGPGAMPDGLVARMESALRAVPVTVSTGVAEWTGRPGGERGLWDALALADRKMFGRKRARQA